MVRVVKTEGTHAQSEGVGAGGVKEERGLEEEFEGVLKMITMYWGLCMVIV